MSNVDSSQVDQLLNQLATETIQQIIFKALKEGASTLKQNTILNLRRPTLNKGVRVKPNKAFNEVQVNIMGDYRLKWFEKGTKDRFTKGHKITGYQSYYSRRLKRTGKGGYRGKMVAEHFFQAARNDKESIYNAMMASITESLNKIQ